MWVNSLRLSYDFKVSSAFSPKEIQNIVLESFCRQQHSGDLWRSKQKNKDARSMNKIKIARDRIVETGWVWNMPTYYAPNNRTVLTLFVVLQTFRLDGLAYLIIRKKTRFSIYWLVISRDVAQ